MAKLTLKQAETIINAAIRKADEMKLPPLTIAVVDDGGNLKAFKREDGPGAALRPHVVIGKAWGAVGFGVSTRRLEVMAKERPHFMVGLVSASDGRLVPVPGGVLIRDADNDILGAVGIGGATSDQDETCAVAGIEAVGLVADVSDVRRDIPPPPR